MSEVVAVTTRQELVYKPYRVGNCECNSPQETLECRDGDWLVEKDQCPDGQDSFIVCSQLDPNVCPVIDSTRGKATRWTSQGSPNVRCEYDINIFNTDQAITDYLNNFGADENFDMILKQACFRPTNDFNKCPIDPLTGENMPNCSNYISSTQLGQECRQASLLPGNELTFTNEMTQYCLNNPTPDCSCVERFANKTYQALKLDSSVNDGCWWKPCGNTTSYIVPPDIVRGNTNCLQVRDKIADEINRRWDRLDCCDLKDFVVYAPNGIEENINCVFTEAGDSQRSWFENYGWWITLIALILILLIVASIIYAYMSPKNSETSIYSDIFTSNDLECYSSIYPY